MRGESETRRTCVLTKYRGGESLTLSVIPPSQEAVRVPQLLLSAPRNYFTLRAKLSVIEHLREPSQPFQSRCGYGTGYGPKSYLSRKVQPAHGKRGAAAGAFASAARGAPCGSWPHTAGSPPSELRAEL